MKRIKQVILIRRDLKMRRGKEIAQGAHASMMFMISQLRSGENSSQLELSDEEKDWIKNGMAKVCLQVASEDELVLHHEKALLEGLKSFIIRDSGRTEFDNVPTFTACAIGPDEESKINAVTGALQIY